MIDQVVTILWNRRNHQDNLIHTRLGWLIATQAFLLIAFFNAYDSTDLCRWVLRLIPVVGLLSTGLVYRSIFCGINTYKEVRERLHKVIEDSESEEVRNNYSKTLLLDRDWPDIKWGGFLPCLFVPPVFIAFWLFLFVIVLLKG